MGEQKVSLLQDEASMQRFVQHLLNDVQALQYMLENDWFEKKNNSNRSRTGDVLGE